MNMNTIYSKVKTLEVSKWIVTKFYRYTSYVNEVVAEYDPFWHDKPWGDSYIKELYDHFLKIAETYFGHRLFDNKTVIEIKNIETGEMLYVGFKDNKYLLGKSVWSEFNGNYEFGFIKK